MVVLRYYRDRQGNTERSLDFFFKASRRIVKEWSACRPLRVLLNSEGFNTPKKEAPYTMRAELGLGATEDNRYVILLSGTQCG